MSVVETILVFVVAPSAVVAVMALLIWARGAATAPRYRPGRDWAHEPVWYAPHPLAVADSEHSDRWARHPELAAGSSRPVEAPQTTHTAAGGARGTW